MALQSPHKTTIPKPVWAVGFAHEQTLRDATLAVFSFLILKRLQHILSKEITLNPINKSSNF
jgi:hypothetical protein